MSQKECCRDAYKIKEQSENANHRSPAFWDINDMKSSEILKLQVSPYILLHSTLLYDYKKLISRTILSQHNTGFIIMAN